MRTMKRVAAVALSVVVLMTSGVSAKAAVTDVQPAKSKEEAVEKWVNKLMPDGVYDTLSEIKVVGNYIYAAEDSNHRIIKINKENGKIEKEHSYYKADYKQYYVGNIGYGDGKVYVSYATQGTNTVGRIEAFNADTLEPVWISEIASHNERSTEGAPYLVVNDVVASKLFYDNGHLYFGTGAGTPGSSYGWDKIGKYYVLDTADEDKNKTDEIKKIKEIASASTEGNFYLKDGIKVGNYIITSDTKGKLFVIDSNTFKVVATKEMNEVFSGGMAYDNTTNTIYFVAGINNLYGIKINTDGSFGETKKVQVYKTGYSAMTPEVYNGKVYLTGSKGTDGIENTGYFAVVDVKSDEYKVNYTVDIPAYSLGEMLVVKTGSDSVRLYFAVNYAKFDENSKALSGGNVYCVDDKQGATSGELKTIYEPDKDHVQLCMNTIHVDEKGTLYYINDSRSIFAIGKKAASITPSTSNATTTVLNETKTKPVTKTVKSTRSVKLTWKKKKSAKGYVIYAKAGKGKYKKVTTVGKKTSKTIKVNKDSSYKFKVKPYKLTKKNKKKYFKAYAAKAKFGSKTVKVTFKNVTGYASYKVQMKAGKAAYKTVKTTTKGGTITYTKKKAKVGTTYKFSLKGINKVNGKTVSVTIK